MSKMCPAGQIENPTYEEDLQLYYRDKIAPRLQLFKECLEESYQPGEQRYIREGNETIIQTSVSETGGTQRSNLNSVSSMIVPNERTRFINLVQSKEGGRADYRLRNRRVTGSEADPSNINSQFVIAIFVTNEVFNTDYDAVINFLRQNDLINRVNLVDNAGAGPDTRRMAQSLQGEIDRLDSSGSPRFIMQELEVIFNNTEDITWSDGCKSVVDSIQEAIDGAPQECITEEEIADPPVPNTEPSLPPTPVAEDPCPTPNEEKWGVRFRYKVGPNANACLPDQSSREGQATGPTYTTHTTTYEERDWFLTLLPAMKSVFPGQLDVPNAMPGLQFRVTSNIAKHRVPGFQPIYQHLGVESTYITMVGTFTGDGGLGMVREITMPSPVEWQVANEDSVLGNGSSNMMAVPVFPEGEVLEGEILSDSTTDLRRRTQVPVEDRTFTVVDTMRVFRDPSFRGQYIILRSPESVVIESILPIDSGWRADTWDELETDSNRNLFSYKTESGFYVSEQALILRTVEGRGLTIDSLRERITQSSEITNSTDIEDAIEGNYNNYALYKVIVDRAPLRENLAMPHSTLFINMGETVLVKEFRNGWALLSSGYWITRSHIRPITQSSIDHPVARRETVPGTYKNGALFLADACMVDCRDPNGIEITPGYAGLADRFVDQFRAAGKPAPNLYNTDSTSRAVWEIAKGLDSYHEFVSFYKLAVQQGNELEVEINVRKNNDGLGPIDGLADDPLRNRETGNPKFKGFLRKMEVYASRSDRTWYQMEFEVTDHALAGTQAINLTYDLNAVIDAAVEDRNARLMEEAETEQIEETFIEAKAYKTSSWSTLYLLPEGTVIERKQINPSSVRESTKMEFYINDLLVSAHDYNQARVISKSEGKVRFRRNYISLPIEISESQYQNLEVYQIQIITNSETTEPEPTTPSSTPQASPINGGGR